MYQTQAHRAALLRGTALSYDCPETPRLNHQQEVWKRFQALTKPAYERLVRNLEGFGNTLSETHREALMCIVGRFTMLASGTHEGRFAYDLPCGGGKTQAVVAWAAELWHQRQPFSVLVCQSQVKHLCDLKRQLIANGVPEGEIGLVHTLKAGGDILPATERNGERRIVLATHQKVRKGSDIAELNDYCGKPRSLVVWDESLLVSDHRAVETYWIKKGLWYLKPDLEDSRASDGLRDTLAYLEEAWSIIDAECTRQRKAHEKGEDPQPVQLALPNVSPEDLARYLGALPKSPAVEPVRQLLTISQAPLRVLTTNQGGGGCIKYDIAVPAALSNVAILDASWTIRDLERLDQTIKDDPRFDGNVKDYREVTVRFLEHASGRDSITKAFKRSRADRKLCREITEVVKTIPEDQGVLVFTFKQQTPKDMNMAETLRGDLKAAGIDVDATLIRDGQEVPRFAWLTWGMETSTSDYQYCPNVIFAGVLHRSDVDLGGAIAGQRDDLTANIPQTEIVKVRRSEIVHSLLQAINRAACRQTINGKAKATNVWLIHHDAKVRPLLEKTMPNMVWKTWNPVVLERRSGKIETLAQAITTALSTLPDHETAVPTRRLKQLVGAEATPSQTWKAALHQALAANPSWTLEARSVVRT